MLQLLTQRLVMFMPCSGRVPHFTSPLLLYIRCCNLPHICLALRYCHLLQYSLRFGYIACCCICFAIIVFYRSEIYCIIFTLSSTMPSVLHILHRCIIDLLCIFLLIHIRNIPTLAIIFVDINGSQVKLKMPSVLNILR